MPETKTDLLMKFVQSNGEAVKAEGAAVIKKDDRLLLDFLPGKFFDVEAFSLGLNIEDDQISANPLNANTSAGTQKTGAPAARPVHKPKFSTWRDPEKTTDELAAISYPVVLEPFSFTRLMDKASPVFFQACCNSVSFESATLVKRKVTGADLSLQSFLRIDFSNVLIIGLDWDDGHILKEKCKFICRGVKVQYKRQASDGSLGAASSAEWSKDLATRTAA